MATPARVCHTGGRPELAALDAAPPDPVWVSIVIACVGFCALTGVIVFLIRDWKSRRP